MTLKANPLRIIFPLLAAFFILFVCGVNFFNQIYRAENKEFWIDEELGLKRTVQGKTFTELISKTGERTEANQSPLDFLCVKVLDEVKLSLNSFGLSDKAYYRLWPNFILNLTCVLVCFLLLYNISVQGKSFGAIILQYLLVTFIPFSILFRPMAYHYAAEVRPYSLWLSIWLLNIFFLIVYPKNKKLIFFGALLLSLTLVGSFFQILSLGCAFLVLQVKKGGGKSAILSSVKIFIIPLALVMYYAYPATYGGSIITDVHNEWAWFKDLWVHELSIVPMMIFSILIFCFNRDNFDRLMGPMAVLFIFLLGPVIFWFTIKKGYFVTNRQYIYYDIHRAAFLMCFVYMLPVIAQYFKNRAVKTLVSVLVILSLIPLVYNKKHINRFSEAAANAAEMRKYFIRK